MALAVALSGTAGHVPGVPFMDTTLAMNRVGNNCGNLVFQYAVSRLIGERYEIIGTDIPWAPERVKDRCRVVVVPSANFLNEKADFTTFVDALERMDLPLVFLGLGAQADDFEKTTFDFHPSVLRLLDLIRERSRAVAVRGEFTARILDRYGVGNVAVVGCPSNFINPAPDFPASLAARLAGPVGSFITHADEPWPKSDKKKEVERRLVAWTRDGVGIMVQQSVPSMMKYLRRNNPSAKDPASDGFEASLARAIMPHSSTTALREFIATRLRTYYSVDQWLEDSSKYDFSLGLRLHGNMVAWQAGVPSLWITHDSRTKELVETMALPNVELDDFLKTCRSVDDAWARLEFDAGHYADRRNLLRDRLAWVLSEHGIAMTPKPVSEAARIPA